MVECLPGTCKALGISAAEDRGEDQEEEGKEEEERKEGT